jgi:hypothetical protein
VIFERLHALGRIAFSARQWSDRSSVSRA